jgi:hypothetical protein
MAVINDGSAVSGAQAVDTNTKAARVSMRPVDMGALGHYSLGVVSGLLPVIGTLTTNAEVFQFRFADATRLALVREITVGATADVFETIGIPIQLDLVKSSGWSGAGTGGTGVTPAATLKMRTSMGSTLIAAGDIRIATTAALGAGTKTLEGNSMAQVIGSAPITTSLSSGIIIPPGTVLYRAEVAHGEYPLTLVQNEGISIRCVNAPALVQWHLSVSIKWAEVTAY